ncbi:MULTISPECIES: DUF2213 domain-containing protein [unclassified Tatumella]|uniref:DUF2213 domain-containing protein n=1 Tax=unclassified Tatumella TaxID=2649542 RepID=UPI001BAEEEB2|nr:MULTISPECIES: DUF2213 domain-containing protein [unclassified Tatumella]MBS0877983.1 DUF2213 domain-containing protein [Tatumella sp. JGM82]MBS0891294.1 DUF2213 domain-containing protein [Tatumella sp. JGM94]MBS0902673.1 DUF2213 domain-containing protein [Tatumella sp. JGM100]
MQYFFISRLGSSRFLLNDGSLLCKNVPIARTGSQLYSADDLPKLEPDDDDEIVVERTPDEVFSPETLASFEGMTVTILHPEDDEGNIKFVDPDNWRELAVGHVQNVRQGTGSQSDLIIADLIIKDEAAISYIENGLREVSCGYDAEYKQTAPGKAKQYQISGNHVALVPNGRAGSRCAIGDRNTMATFKKSWVTRFRQAMKTGDADTMNELLESAPTGDEGDLPKGVNLNINLSPQNPMPDKDSEMGGKATADDDDVPDWAKALIARLDKLEGKTTDSDDQEDKDKTGDAEDDEDKEEETTATGDAAYRADLILPGIDLKKMKPTAFKRHVLASADQSLVRQIVGDAAIKTLKKPVVDMAFTAVSELAKNRNTGSQRTADAQRTTGSISSINERNQAFWKR